MCCRRLGPCGQTEPLLISHYFTVMLHLPGLQAVDPHELERWRDATFVMSKRVRHLDNLGSLQTSTWDYERFTI
jgi:hypothetical protein